MGTPVINVLTIVHPLLLTSYEWLWRWLGWATWSGQSIWRLNQTLLLDSLGQGIEFFLKVVIISSELLNFLLKGFVAKLLSVLLLSVMLMSIGGDNSESTKCNKILHFLIN